MSHDVVIADAGLSDAANNPEVASPITQIDRRRRPPIETPLFRGTRFRRNLVLVLGELVSVSGKYRFCRYENARPETPQYH